MFIGNHLTKLEPANSLPLRPDWHKLLSGGGYVTQGFDQNLFLMAPDTFEALYSQFSSLNIADPLARLFLRMFLGSANYVQPQPDGTITLPQELLQYAALESNVVVVGQGDYVEVWSSHLWQQQIVDIQDARSNAQRFASLSISIQSVKPG